LAKAAQVLSASIDLKFANNMTIVKGQGNVRADNSHTSGIIPYREVQRRGKTGKELRV